MNKKHLIGALAVTAACVSVPASAGAAIITVTVPVQTLSIDSKTGTARTTAILAGNTTYDVRVTGAYSAYAASLYNRPVGSFFATCGTPGTAPQFPSAGTNGPTGADAEFLFAAPAPNFRCGNFKPPYKSDKFQVDTGSGFVDPVPASGAPAVSNSGHSYSYKIKTGRGLVAPPMKFKIGDSSYGDNYGKLQIEISYTVISL